LSKDLTPAEHNYWPTELETAALIWMLQKVPHFLDNGKITVYTDHKAIMDTFKDMGPVNKRSVRLANWRLFLSKYQDRMDIKHRPGKTHANADGLSRIPRKPATDHVLHPAEGPIQLQKHTFPVYAFPVQTRAAAKNDTKTHSTESGDLMQFDKQTPQPQSSPQAGWGAQPTAPVQLHLPTRVAIGDSSQLQLLKARRLSNQDGIPLLKDSKDLLRNH
jgi:hypothetical protein